MGADPELEPLILSLQREVTWRDGVGVGCPDRGDHR